MVGERFFAYTKLLVLQLHMEMGEALKHFPALLAPEHLSASMILGHVSMQPLSLHLTRKRQ